MLSEEDEYLDPFFPTKVADLYTLCEVYGKEYECMCCHQTIQDPFKEQFTKNYNSFMATFTLARAFNHVVRQIGFIFDRENLSQYYCSRSLSLLEYLVKKVEKKEQIVKAFKEEFGDDKHQEALEIVQRCKKLPDLVREWPLKKEDVRYFIDSMENILAILRLLCKDDSKWMVPVVDESFCTTEIGWHKPPPSYQVKQLGPRQSIHLQQ